MKYLQTTGIEDSKFCFYKRKSEKQEIVQETQIDAFDKLSTSLDQGKREKVAGLESPKGNHIYYVHLEKTDGQYVFTMDKGRLEHGGKPRGKLTHTIKSGYKFNRENVNKALEDIREKYNEVNGKKTKGDMPSYIKPFDVMWPPSAQEVAHSSVQANIRPQLETTQLQIETEQKAFYLPPVSEPARYRSIAAPTPVKPKSTGQWSRKAQEVRAQEIAAENLSYRVVKSGDTLGTIVKGLTGNMDLSQAVDYRDPNYNHNPKQLRDANLIYPGQKVWIENIKGVDTIVVSDNAGKKNILPALEVKAKAASGPIVPEKRTAGGPVLPILQKTSIRYASQRTEEVTSEKTEEEMAGGPAKKVKKIKKTTALPSLDKSGKAPSQISNEEVVASIKEELTTALELSTSLMDLHPEALSPEQLKDFRQRIKSLEKDAKSLENEKIARDILEKTKTLNQEIKDAGEQGHLDILKSLAAGRVNLLRDNIETIKEKILTPSLVKDLETIEKSLKEAKSPAEISVVSKEIKELEKSIKTPMAIYALEQLDNINTEDLSIAVKNKIEKIRTSLQVSFLSIESVRGLLEQTKYIEGIAAGNLEEYLIDEKASLRLDLQRVELAITNNGKDLVLLNEAQTVRSAIDTAKNKIDLESAQINLEDLTQRVNELEKNRQQKDRLREQVKGLNLKIDLIRPALSGVKESLQSEIQAFETQLNNQDADLVTISADITRLEAKAEQIKEIDFIVGQIEWLIKQLPESMQIQSQEDLSGTLQRLNDDLESIDLEHTEDRLEETLNNMASLLKDEGIKVPEESIPERVQTKNERMNSVANTGASNIISMMESGGLKPGRTRDIGYIHLKEGKLKFSGKGMNKKELERELAIKLEDFSENQKREIVNKINQKIEKARLKPFFEAALQEARLQTVKPKRKPFKRSGNRIQFKTGNGWKSVLLKPSTAALSNEEKAALIDQLNQAIDNKPLQRPTSPTQPLSEEAPRSKAPLPPVSKPTEKTLPPAPNTEKTKSARQQAAEQARERQRNRN